MKNIILLFLCPMVAFSQSGNLQDAGNGALITAATLNYWAKDGSNNLSYTGGTTTLYTNNTYLSRLGIQGNNSPSIWANDNRTTFADYQVSGLSLTNGIGYYGSGDRTWRISNTYLSGNSHMNFTHWNGTAEVYGGTWWYDGNFTVGGAFNTSHNTGEKFQVKGTTRLGWDILAQTTPSFTSQTVGGLRSFYNVVGSPESAITASPGDIAYATIASVGYSYIKRTGSGTNTGWSQILSKSEADGASSGQVLKWNGTAWLGAAESDASSTNELQTYAHSGTTSYTNTLSNSGGSFTLQAGTGASISNSSGTVTISGNSAGNGLTLGGTTMSAGGTLTSGITWTTGDQTVLFTKASNTGTATPVAIQVNNSGANRTALDIRGTGGSSAGQLIITEEGQLTIENTNGAGYINLDAGTRLFRMSDAGNIELPEASSYSTNEGFLFYKAGKLWYGDGFTNREVASADKHLKGTYGTITTTTTIGSAMLGNVIDANGGAFTVSIGTDLIEGVEYRIRCERNGTNAITFSAINSCNFHIDGDATQTRTSFTAGASGTGYEAPYLIYRVTRWGTDIFVDL